MYRILGKSNPEKQLIEHISDIYNVWNDMYKIYKDDIKDREFWRNSLISILGHDIGKFIENFQCTINKNDKRKLSSIRHEFISGVIFILNGLKNDTEKLWILAILSHHLKMNDKNLEERFQDDSLRKILMEQEKLNYILEYIENILKKSEINYKFSENIKFKFCNLNGRQLYERFNNFYKIVPVLDSESRKRYIYYKGILNISDWISSASESFKIPISYTEEGLKNKIIRKLIKEGKIKSENEFKFKKFQLESKIRNNIIAISSTGSGKTEGSLLWASLKKNNGRLLFLLPTRVTANSIYDRLSKYFGKENTSIIHSSAYYYLKNENEEYDKLEYLKDKCFFKSINICTVDQVLTQGFNLGYWEMKTFNMLNAKVIIDEIHLYSPYTLGLIISTIIYLKKNFNVSFYIMSATMPNILKELLKDALGDKVKIIKDKELMKLSRNVLEFRNCYVDEIDSEIVDSINQKKKILIVVNTVNEAIKLYEKYKKKINTVCYHSRFINKDRIEKEKELYDIERSENKKGILLIATQVVEVSLDIDYDILFTENAPIDALIQRFGRINRERKKSETKVIVFRHSEVSEKYIYDKEGILEKSFEIIKKYNGSRPSEKSFINMVEELYEGYNIKDDIFFIEGLNRHKEVQENNNYIKDKDSDSTVFTREGLDSISVIPWKFYEKTIDTSIEEKLKYEVSVRDKKWLSKEIQGKFTYLKKTKYSYEKGLEFLKEEKTEILNF